MSTIRPFHTFDGPTSMYLHTVVLIVQSCTSSDHIRPIVRSTDEKIISHSARENSTSSKVQSVQEQMFRRDYHVSSLGPNIYEIDSLTSSDGSACFPQRWDSSDHSSDRPINEGNYSATTRRRRLKHDLFIARGFNVG
jgi:hypothetical protein